MHTFPDGSKGIKHENNYMILHGSEMLTIANMSQLDTEKAFPTFILDIIYVDMYVYTHQEEAAEYSSRLKPSPAQKSLSFFLSFEVRFAYVLITCSANTQNLENILGGLC